MNNNNTVLSPEVVFVQLGNARCDHLWANLERLAENFPQLKLTVILDAKSRLNAPIDKNWNYWLYHAEDATRKIIEQRSEDPNFRNGFWSFTLERLFAFTSYQKSVRDKPMLHIESDILVFPDFPFSKFVELDKLAWMRVDSKRDVAAIVYSPSKFYSNFLQDQMLAHLSRVESTTDMDLLFQIRTLNSNQVQVLPSLDARNHAQATSLLDYDLPVLSELSSGLTFFGGIFDPAATGIWLTGTDPRNHFGTTLYGDTEFIVANGSYVNPNCGTYSYTRESGLVIESINSKTRVWTLHIHSKDLRLFSDNWEEY